MSKPAPPDLVFADAGVARKYVQFRPQPPPSLINEILLFWNQGKGRSSETEEGAVPQRSPHPGTLLVDVGCGSGQSTHQFADYFEKVVGIDVSPDQLEEARKKFLDAQNMSFREGDAEHIPFSERSVDVVTVCAAVHWFNLPVFYAEVDKVLKPGGVLAVFGYLNAYPLHQGKCLRSVMMEQWDALDFWPPEHLHLKSDYANLPPAYDEDVYFSAADGKFEVSKSCPLSDVLGYMSSWSAMAKYKAKHGTAAVRLYLEDSKAKLLQEMDCKEDDPEVIKRHRYFLRMWRKPLSDNTI